MKRVGTRWKPAKRLSQLTLEEMNAFKAEHRGDFIAIPIDGYFGFGRYIDAVNFAYYDLKSDSVPPLEEIETRPVIFILPTERMAMVTGRWRMIGNKPLDERLSAPIKYFRYQGPTYVDVYVAEQFQPYAGEDLTKMERLAVWSAKNVESRLRCHFNGTLDVQTERFKIPREHAEKFRRDYFARQGALTEKK